MFTTALKKYYLMHLSILIRLFIVIVFVLLSMCSNRIENKRDTAHTSSTDTLVIDFGSIINAYKSIDNKFNANNYIYKKEFLSFDFSKLSQSDKVNGANSKFEAYFSKNGDIMKIIKYDKRFMDLEFSVVKRPSFTIVIILNHENGARYSGFILNYKGKLYYFNSSKTTDSFLWEADSDYSTIMELDSDLEVKFICKFYKDRLLYKSSVTYNNEGELDEEYYNICREVVRVNQKTSFTEFQESTNKQQSFLFIAKSKYMIEDGQTLNQPLWTYEGEHTGILTN